MSDAFEQIKRLVKRTDHFCPPPQGVHNRYLAEWGLCLDGIEPRGAGVAVHNYALMQSLHDTYTERLCWLDALAASLNRYIDAHQVKGDVNTRRCLRWWRRQLFFVPEVL